MYFPRMRDLRREANKRQTDLAKTLNVTQATYSNYENGKIDLPVCVLIQLCEYYDVSLDYFTGRTGWRR